jgi:hypothetical protein
MLTYLNHVMIRVVHHHLIFGFSSKPCRQNAIMISIARKRMTASNSLSQALNSTTKGAITEDDHESGGGNHDEEVSFIMASEIWNQGKQRKVLSSPHNASTPVRPFLIT